jgi:hypothetical protein
VDWLLLSRAFLIFLVSELFLNHQDSPDISFSST